MEEAVVNAGEELVAVSESPEALELVEKGFRRFGIFCRTFLYDNFTIPFSSLHNKFLKLVDKKRPRKKVVVCAPRGFGKTTTARAICAQAICYATARFIVYISNSATSAELQTENLKKDLLSREIKEVFGDIRTRKADMADESWSKKTWVASTANGEHYTLVLPRGSGQQIRGLVWKTPDGKSVRPDLIVVDDLEDSETIENEEIRKKRSVWFFGDVLKSVSLTNPNWSIYYIDTLKHYDSLITTLLEASDWEHLHLSICNDNYESLAPDFKSTEEIKAEVQAYREAGMLDVFARENMGIAIAKEDAAFRPEYFIYYSESDPEFIAIKNRLTNVVIIDPAKTAKMHAAETGFVVWGIDLQANKLYLRYARGERLHPDEIFDRGIEMCRIYNSNVIGIESTGSREFITYPLTNEIIRRGLVIEVVELSARKGQGEFAGLGGGKKMRISSLIAYYRRGAILHEKDNCAAFEAQLLAFPRGKRVDVIDAGAYITEMLDKGGRFFFPSGVDENDPVTIEAEYEELENEPPIESFSRAFH